jgi:hypothetical protein
LNGIVIKRLLDKHFTIDIDYKVLPRQSPEQMDNMEKVVHSMDTLGGSQEVTFNNVLLKSREPEEGGTLICKESNSNKMVIV